MSYTDDFLLQNLKSADIPDTDIKHSTPYTLHTLCGAAFSNGPWKHGWNEWAREWLNCPRKTKIQYIAQLDPKSQQQHSDLTTPWSYELQNTVLYNYHMRRTLTHVVSRPNASSHYKPLIQGNKSNLILKAPPRMAFSYVFCLLMVHFTF